MLRCSECTGKKLSSAGPSLIAGSNHSGSMPPLQTPQLQESSPSSDVSCRTQRPTTQQIEAVISAAVSAARKAAASTVFAAIQVAQVTRVRLSAEPVTKAPSGKKVLYPESCCCTLCCVPLPSPTQGCVLGNCSRCETNQVRSLPR